SRPEGPHTTVAVMLPERVCAWRAEHRMGPGKTCGGRGSRCGCGPRERLVGPEQKCGHAERSDKSSIDFMRHGAFHSFLLPPPKGTLCRAFRARKHIINVWLRRNVNGAINRAA